MLQFLRFDTITSAKKNRIALNIRCQLVNNISKKVNIFFSLKLKLILKLPVKKSKKSRCYLVSFVLCYKKVVRIFNLDYHLRLSSFAFLDVSSAILRLTSSLFEISKLAFFSKFFITSTCF